MLTRDAVGPQKEAVDLRQEAMTALNQLMPQAVEVLRTHLSCGVADVEVNAARVILQQVALPQAAYSFTGHTTNQTNYTLKLKSENINGSWDTKPPDAIAPGASPEWSAHYDGFHFKGKVIYEANDGEFEMTWDIPLFGNNSIGVKTSIPSTKARHEGGRGWHAEVWYYLEAV